MDKQNLKCQFKRKGGWYSTPEFQTGGARF